MTSPTTRVRYDEIHELRRPRILCFACCAPMQPDDVVELEVPVVVDVVPRGMSTMVWHANESCAANEHVLSWLARNPVD